jgi:hypothetical protein
MIEKKKTLKNFRPVEVPIGFTRILDPDMKSKPRRLKWHRRKKEDVLYIEELNVHSGVPVFEIL